MKNETTQKYSYPIGDFLSGFSEDSQNPCGYELECKRMVIRGMEYLDEHPEIVEKVNTVKVKPFNPILKEMIDFMCVNEANPKFSGNQSGAMVDHTVRVTFVAKKTGWDQYIELITKNK